MANTDFEWDPNKNARNLAKHGVDFDLAAGPRQRTPEQEEQAAHLAGMKDEDIDTSDIPEITEEQWSNSELFRPKKVFTSFRCDADVLVWLKSKGRGYNTRMNQILRAAMLDEKTRAN